MRRRGGWVLAFDEAVRTILKLSEAKVDIGKNMNAVIDGMTECGVLYGEGVREFKKRFVTRVIDRNQGNQCKAARELGMHRNTLSRTISELGINMEELRPQRRPIGVEKISQVQEVARRA